jgi:hypothetical protein
MIIFRPGNLSDATQGALKSKDAWEDERKEGVRFDYSNPKCVVKLIHQHIIHKIAELGEDHLDGIRGAGFQTTSG